LVVFVAIASSVFFRRHSLGTRGRIALAAVAVLLVVVPPLVRGELGWRNALAALAVVAVLGSGIAFLRRNTGHPPGE
jgi:drug/metabolite transporter (DMT)-like permease